VFCARVLVEYEIVLAARTKLLAEYVAALLATDGVNFMNGSVKVLSQNAVAYPCAFLSGYTEILGLS